jgi:hypothetical protein
MTKLYIFKIPRLKSNLFSKSLLSKRYISLFLILITGISVHSLSAQTTALPEIDCPPDVVVNKDAETCGASHVDLGTPTLINNTPLTGNALDFEGIENGITAPDITPLLLRNFQVTVSAWVNPRVENTTNPDLAFLNDIMQLNTWQHIALTFDAQTLKVYYNGDFIGSIKLNIPLGELLDQDIHIGTDINVPISFESLKHMVTDNLPFTTLGGTIDEVRIWNIIRTQEQIKNDMNNEISAQPGLIALYHLNQGIAGGDNAGVTTAIDASGNGFDVKLNDFVLNGPSSNWVEGKTFSGITITNDAPVAYNPTVFDIGNNAEATVTFNGSNVATFPVGDTTVTWTATDADGNSVSCTQTVTVTNDENIWTGNINTDWDNSGNWEDGAAPGFMLSSSVTIPAGLANYPVLNASENLYIGNCSSVTIDSGASLNVSANAVVTNDGIVTNNGSLIFESDNSGSAYIGTSSGSFVGDATIERFIPARRAFRFLSSPVTTDDYISNNWQLGTHITGSRTGANGFDITNTGNPSMFSYDNVTQRWNAIANTDATNLVSGVPYRVFVRGDRTVDLLDNFATPSETTLVSTGVLTSENNEVSEQIPLNATAGGFSFVGNPFQAQMNMQTTLLNNTTNVNPTFYWVWDPNLGIRGAYATVIVPSGTATAGEQNQYLQAGQACFVQTTASSPAFLAFTQENKFTSAPETKVFKSSGNSKVVNTGQLNLKLYERNALASNGTEADGLWIFFDDNGNNDVDAFDAVDFTNLDENFATKNGNTLLSVENRATPKDGDEILLEINTYRNTEYTIVANAVGLQGDLPILLDTYLDIRTEISQDGETRYDYTIDTGIPASFAGDRFKIIFQSNGVLSTDDIALNNIAMYPNPSNTGDFYLTIPQGIDNLEVNIYNALGAKVFHSKNLTTGTKIPFGSTSNKSNGIYFVELTSNDLTTTKKLIIN